MDRSTTARHLRRDRSVKLRGHNDEYLLWLRPQMNRDQAIREQREYGADILSDPSLVEPDVYSVSDEMAVEAAEQGLIEHQMRRDPQDWRDWFSLHAKLAA